MVTIPRPAPTSQPAPVPQPTPDQTAKPDPSFRILVGGKTDWFIPSVDEAWALLQRSSLVGAFPKGADYWTSTWWSKAAWEERDFVYAWRGNTFHLDQSLPVRPIRAF
jgi:hypothetical protein